MLSVWAETLEHVYSREVVALAMSLCSAGCTARDVARELGVCAGADRGALATR